MSIFMQIDGIKGEAIDSGHKDWIDVDSYGWIAARGITSKSSTQGDRESSTAAISDLRINKKMDSASNKLFIASCCGKGKTVILHLTKTGSGSGSDVYMEYTFHNALISHYEVNGDADDIDRPSETLLISFTEMEARYTPYKEDGTAGSAESVGFDTATNTKK